MALCSVISLYSGSRGNSVLIKSPGASILIDAGRNTKALLSALSEAGVSADKIDAIFITHEHTDHISALPVLLKRYNIPVHAPSPVARVIEERCSETAAENICSHPPIYSTRVGDMLVSSFPTPHDSECSVGYRIEVLEGDNTVAAVGYATDIGCVTDEIRGGLSGCESVVIEANHDSNMLLCGPYPYELKMRIKSRIGHLSNAECAEFVGELCRLGTKNVLLAHLSEENNDPVLACREVVSSLGEGEVNVAVAAPHHTVRLV